MNTQLISELKNPGSEYRGAPFWAWNGKLSPDELRRQIRIMRRMGLGGFFMHSRVGLNTPYLSKEWMDCVAACVDEAEKLDLQAWLYDEDRWPSGAAGGLVTRNEKYRMHLLMLDHLGHAGRIKWSKEVLAAFVVKIKTSETEKTDATKRVPPQTLHSKALAKWRATLRRGRKGSFETEFVAVEARQLPRNQRPAPLTRGEEILVFRDVLQPCSDWYNGYTYLDTMNPKAVEKFIAVTHAAYLKNFPEAIGKRIPGIFTDEPNYGSVGGFVRSAKPGDRKNCVLPWTPSLPKVFKKRYGYDLLPRLAELFYQAGDEAISPVRRDYYDCITFVFVDAFSRQVGQWCEKHKCAFTGHVLAEETLLSQTAVVGSAMRFYEYMQAPGMDLLTEFRREYDTAKQVTSMARQFGRRWRLTETYGCTGWDFNFAGHKALGDWQAALGINLRCQHLAWFTMEGQAKRDYPAAIFYQSPWWELYPKVEDYFARLHVFMSRGKEIRDLLVIHPIESMWAVMSHGNTWRRDRLHEDFWKLRDTFLAGHVDFDYGDEDILARHGKIGKQPGQAILQVARADYRAVVVPTTFTLRRSTLDLLRSFRRAGGTVVFAGGVPEYVDGKPCSDAKDFAASCASDWLLGDGTPALSEAEGPSSRFLRPGVRPSPSKSGALNLCNCVSRDRIVKAVASKARRVSIVDAKGREIAPVLYCLREDKDDYYLFLCNTSDPVIGRKEADIAVRNRKLAFPKATIRISGAGTGTPIECDLASGKLMNVKSRIISGLDLTDKSGGGPAASSLRSQKADFGGVGPRAGIPTDKSVATERDGHHTNNQFQCEIETSFPALGSRIFIIPKTAQRRLGVTLRPTGRAKPQAEPELMIVRKAPIAQKKWPYRLSEENCLVLDRPEYRIGARAWQAAEEILRIDDKVRTAIGLRIRGGQMVQPWARKPNPNPKRVNVALRYRFQVDYLPSGEFHLAIEQPRTFKISMNGIPVSTIINSGWWCDKSLRRIPLDPALLRPGVNELILECDYAEAHPGLEIVYLLGNFGTRAAGTSARITQLPDGLKLGDWGKQGLAFYGGSVTYLARVRPKLKRGERLFVAVPDYRGVAVRIMVDGRPAGLIAWEPNEIDITALVTGEAPRGKPRGIFAKPCEAADVINPCGKTQGFLAKKGRKEVLVGIEVIGHRRNSHGPLHLAVSEPPWIGPAQFKTTGKEWSESYRLVPCGLMQAPRLVIKKSTDI